VSKFQKQKIKDIFQIEKGTLQSSKNIPGNFHFVTASAEWKTHNKYTHDCEALVFAHGSSGSLGRTHYVTGKFISSDLCFILTPREEVKEHVFLQFYYYYFNFSREKLVGDLKKGTTKIAINRSDFSNYPILLPGLDIQLDTYEKMEKMNGFVKMMETMKQDSEKLMQAFLQERFRL
jgi:type I restriction enzyme, S subunit